MMYGRLCSWTFVYFLLAFFWVLILYELWYTLFGPCSDVPLNKDGKEPLFGFSGGGCSDDEKAQKKKLWEEGRKK